jgi:hypothetical protein
VLAGEVVTDIAVEEGAFRIGLQEQLEAGGRDLEIEIALAAAELDFKTARKGIVEGGSQKGRFQRDAHEGSLKRLSQRLGLKHLWGLWFNYDLPGMVEPFEVV